MHRRLILLAGLALLGGCAPTAPLVRPAPAPLAELEPVYSAVAGRETLVVRVSSNGCTKKEDFAVHVDRTGGAATLAFARKRLDPCQSFARGHSDLTFTWEEMGLAASSPVFLLNPLEGWTGP